jgi:hypothetical protein
MDDKQNGEVRLYFCNELITQTNTIKYLGTELESNHQNKEHVIKIERRLLSSRQTIFSMQA